MRAWIWLRVTLLLTGFWLIVHGPRLPAPRAGAELEIVSTVLGVILASSLLIVLTGIGWMITRDVEHRVRIWGAPPRLWITVAAAGIGLAWTLDGGLQLGGWASSSALGRLQTLFSGLGPLERIGAAIVLGVVPGIAEELCFRGWLLGRLTAASSPGIALGVSSAVFGIFHFDPLHAAMAAALGLVLGLSVLRLGVLGPAMAAHALNNGLAVAGAGFRSTPVRLGIVTVVGVAMFAWGIRVLWRYRPDSEAPTEPAAEAG